MSQSVSFNENEVLVKEQQVANELKQDVRPNPGFGVGACQKTGKPVKKVVDNNGRGE